MEPMHVTVGLDDETRAKLEAIELAVGLLRDERPDEADLLCELASLRLMRAGLEALHQDAKRWLTESEDRPNLRAAECRIGKAIGGGLTDLLYHRRHGHRVVPGHPDGVHWWDVDAALRPCSRYVLPAKVGCRCSTEEFRLDGAVWRDG